VLEQRLVEGLHAVVGALNDRLLELSGLVGVLDHVADPAGHPEDLADRDSAVRESAQKVLVLAKEGLDMVSQVSGVLDGTIVSAEEWCERMGKKRRDSRELQNQPVLPQVEPNNDVKMG
jgi:hypothetical protein